MSEIVDRATSRGSLMELALSFVVAPLALPPIWGFCRIAVGVMDVSDPTVAAPAFAALAWVATIVTLAVLAWKRWRRPRIAAGLLLSLVTCVVLGGIALFGMVAAAGSGIRG